MAGTILQIAQVIHAAICEYNHIYNLFPDPSWEEASEEEREQRAHTVAAALEEANFDPEFLHMTWFERKYNKKWSFGPVKDRDAKTHPAMLPWPQLPNIYKMKARLFGAMLHAFAHAPQ